MSNLKNGLVFFLKFQIVVLESNANFEEFNLPSSNSTSTGTYLCVGFAYQLRKRF